MNHDIKGGQAGRGPAAGQQDQGTGGSVLTYRLCPRCLRAVPGHSAEHFCVNDGEKLLDACPACHAPILSPYAQFCAGCGQRFFTAGVRKRPGSS
ncbi:MAG: hypothetical protein JWQ08_2393 [Deinococcus sp.]|nr:hypothetical protein [Deinococcus sp.]